MTMGYVVNILKLMRVKQYIKNLLIFAPLFFAHEIFSLESVVKLLVVFVGFSLVASFIYILNDIKDVEADKKHPKKSLRPIANGKISKKTGGIVAAILLILGCVTLLKFNCLQIVGFYVVLNLLYIYKFKNYALLDVIFISFGYLIRLFLGGQVAGVPLSNWIIIMTFLLSLFLAVSKRYDDLQYGEKDLIRENINGYNAAFIQIIMSVTAAVLILSYIMYTISPSIISQYNCEYLFATSLFVIVGLLRYLQLVFVYKKSHSPTNIIYSDLFLKITIALWIASYLCVIYL